MPTNPATEAMLRAEDAAAADPHRDRSKAMQSFTVRDLSVLAYANGFTLWHYKAAHVADLLSSNYFGDNSDMMATGDHIHVSAPDGSALLAVERIGTYQVSVRKMLS